MMTRYAMLTNRYMQILRLVTAKHEHQSGETIDVRLMFRRWLMVRLGASNDNEAWSGGAGR